MSTELKVSMSIPSSVEKSIFILELSLEVVLCADYCAAEAVAVLGLHQVVESDAHAIVSRCGEGEEVDRCLAVVSGLNALAVDDVLLVAVHEARLSLAGCVQEPHPGVLRVLVQILLSVSVAERQLQVLGNLPA